MNERQIMDKDDLLPEYDLDYSKAKPNHFADRVKRNTVLLDEDVARVFETSESVNRVLRALIQALPLLDQPNASKAIPSATR